MTLVAGKIWGQTQPMISTPLIEMHKITVLPGSRCSKHVQARTSSARTWGRGMLNASPAFAGIRVIQTPYATALDPIYKWDRDPLTDDMRAMVDDLRERTPSRRVPAAYMTRAGLVVHPDFYRELQRRTAPVGEQS